MRLLFVNTAGHGLDFSVSEITHHLPEHLLLIAELELEHMYPLHGYSGRAGSRDYSDDLF